MPLNRLQSWHNVPSDHELDRFSYLFLGTLISIHVPTHLPNMISRLVCDQKIPHPPNSTLTMVWYGKEPRSFQILGPQLMDYNVLKMELLPTGINVSTI